MRQMHCWLFRWLPSSLTFTEYDYHGILRSSTSRMFLCTLALWVLHVNTAAHNNAAVSLAREKLLAFSFCAANGFQLYCQSRRKCGAEEMPSLELNLCAVQTPTFIQVSRREVKHIKPAACIQMQGTRSMDDEHSEGFSKRVTSHQNSSYKL